MRELNLAYALVKTPGARAAFDRRRRMSNAVEAVDNVTVQTAPKPTPADARSARLTFGRYAGWTLSQVARFDVDYLRWLSRHSSGIRFKTEIDTLLKARGVPA
jgi:hypothetical protein